MKDNSQDENHGLIKGPFCQKFDIWVSLKLWDDGWPDIKPQSGNSCRVWNETQNSSFLQTQKKKKKHKKTQPNDKWYCQRRLTNKRSYSWGEDGAALNDEGHPCSHHDRNVASHPAEGEGEVCSRTQRREVSNKPDDGSAAWLHTLHPEQARSFDQSGDCSWAFSVTQQDWWTWRRAGSTREAVPVLLIKHHHGGRCADYQTGCRESFDREEFSHLCWAPSWWPQPPAPSAWSWAAWRWGWGRCRGRAETEPGEWGPRPGLTESCWRRCACLQRTVREMIGI